MGEIYQRDLICFFVMKNWVDYTDVKHPYRKSLKKEIYPFKKPKEVVEFRVRLYSNSKRETIWRIIFG